MRARLTLSGWALLRAAPSIVVAAILTLILVLPVGLFMILAFSPRLFDQGDSWLTLSTFATAIQGGVLKGIVNSVVVSSFAAVCSLAFGLGIAWFTTRTSLLARRFWPFLIWAVLMSPSYLIALGWESLLGRNGALWELGIRIPELTTLFFGPAGVVFLYILKGVPYAYLSVSWALGALGGEFEDAARIHGAGRWRTWRVLLPMIAPAIWSALAIVFAETISDFGVAFTLAASSKFSLATYTLFYAVDNFPAQFSVAAAVGWFLVAAAAGALLLQARALRGRVYGVLSGRTRQPVRATLGPRGQLLGLALVGGYFAIALGVPAFGAILGSLVKPAGPGAGSFTLTYYQALFDNASTAEVSEALATPLRFSAQLAATAATVVAVIAVPLALYLTRTRASAAARLVDLLLLGTVALPGIVLGAGYIFTYNLPLLSQIGIQLYGTTPLLAMAYMAGVLPNATRIMMGPVAQVDQAPVRAARVHGAGPLGAIWHALIPVVSRSLLWAWILAFTLVLFELPVSQLLYPAGSPPISVAINRALGEPYYGPATAMSVGSVIFALGVVCLLFGAFRLLAPRGWRQIGATT